MVRLGLEGVGASYGRTEVLRDITTPRFEAGDVVAVIGPNAAGKSTLFKRIAGLIGGAGTVTLEGASAGAVCYMPQDTASNAVLSVYEALVLARMQGGSLRVSERDLKTVDDAVAVLGVGSITGSNIGSLSGGQRQLVGIAQVLVREPRVLLMDEPTSALDLHRQIEVLALVQRLARERGMIIFIALHDLNHALRFANHALVIADGTLNASGPVDDIVTAELLRRVYRIEARIEPCSRGFRQVIVDGVARE